MAFTQRTLGGVSVCPIGLGCMPLSFAYCGQPSEEMAAAILTAHSTWATTILIPLGYRHFRSV